MIKIAILTVSDSCAREQREDVSGRTIESMLTRNKFEVCEKKIVEDDLNAIADQLKYFCDKVGVNVVLTTGGTGPGPRDVTPEATNDVSERIVPGLSEIIRAKGWEQTKNAVLSRGIAGIRNKTLIVNLPGSAKAAKESLEVILDVLPHAVEMILGGGH
ncbi:MAG: MogA/MoaB family molybdenum cofactor biosynthesis protein [Planctomycetota bacterium]|nr:MAG: MogA/MoaB family molybdenum cofactor biosynthesis protein [Planctomycetota bacterium]